MEHIVAKLLEDFEQGKMSRRQLIQSLALAATAAASVGTSSAQPAPAAGRSLKALGINHINLEVADYTKTRDFYAGVLGMKITDEEGTRLERPRPRCKIWAGDIYLWPRTRPGGINTSQIDHIGYRIENWNKETVGAELKRRGLNPRPDNANGDSWHIYDPDGLDVQVGGGNQG
jgi:catechol 2,3-dioxygenase-like lactoylglutathione lyase family enzyme